MELKIHGFCQYVSTQTKKMLRNAVISSLYAKSATKPVIATENLYVSLHFS